MYKRYINWGIVGITIIVFATACTSTNLETTKQTNRGYSTADESNKPIIIAHRGANDRFNESTLTAYQIAAKDGVDFLEIDLRMTEDGRFIAIHDLTIDRTTKGKGEITDFTLKEIKEFETVEVFQNQTTTEEIPTLEEIFAMFGNSENYYIETRLVDGKTVMEEPLIDLLGKHKFITQKNVIIQSFSKESLQRVNEIDQDIPLTLLYKKRKFDLEDAKKEPYQMIGIESTDVTKEVVDVLHNQGKLIHVYFTDKETQKEEQRRVMEYGVDGYFTDYIEYTKKMLGR